jgi:hypothetical protein
MIRKLILLGMIGLHSFTTYETESASMRDVGEN